MKPLPESRAIVFCRFLRALGCVTLLLMGGIAANAQPISIQWVRHLTVNAEPQCMAADSSGNAYVAGSGFVAKSDIAGNTLWVRNSAATVRDIALDGYGNVYAVGYFRGTLNFGGGDLVANPTWRTGG